MRISKKALPVMLAAAGLAAAVTATIAAGSPGVTKPEDNADLARARSATARFHDVSVAEAAGYVSTEACVSGPAGAMGIHYVNPELFGDGVADIDRPDVLLYVPKDGGMKLVAVEYVVFDADQDPSTDEDRPALFGSSFDGPVEPPEHGQPIVYTLHAWLWHANPAGILSEWNPTITCPST